jgi:PadR family transcriptional regulator PadR
LGQRTARHCQRDQIQLRRSIAGGRGIALSALHRLIKRRWISAEEGTSENNRRAKFYRLTAKGWQQLAAETSKWDKLAAIAQILRPAD